MSRDDGSRLAPGERALWFLQRLAPGSGAYNLAGAIAVEGLDAEALRRALLRLVARHPALRTTYPAEGGEPFRWVHEQLAPDILEEDLDGDSGALRRRLEAEAVRPFDPAVGPLARLRIFSAAGGVRAVLFVLHHLVADFGSLAVALGELGRLYGEETGGPAADLGPAGAPYAEWVADGERALAAERGESLRRFWQERLGGPAPVLALPADRPRPPAPSGAGDSRSARLAPAATARLLATGRRHGATLFVTLLAGFQLLLHRLSGDDEVWLGVPTVGRSAAKWAGTVGYFVNPVVMRSRLAGTPPFTEFLAGAREEAREALAHRDWPFPLLAGQLHASRDGAQPPLFRTMLTVHRSRRPEEEALALLALGEAGGRTRLGGLALETLALRRRAAQLDLTLTAAVAGGALHTLLEVDADLFDGTTAARLLGHLAALLTAAGERPETPVDALPLLSEAERQELLVEWNDTAEEAASAEAGETSLSGLVAAQAARTPAAVALVCGGESLTYGELIEQVDELARRLRGAGVGAGGAETRVALCAGRSPRLVVAVLAILAAGGAYVPLDPGHPAERLRFLLADSGAALLVTETELASRFGFAEERRILLDGLAPHPPAPSPIPSLPPGEGEKNGGSLAGEGRVAAPLSRGLGGDGRGDGGEGLAGGPGAARRLAYILYTSGSTGRPKGVEIEHGSALALLRWARRTFAPDERAAVLAATSLGFDLSVFELFLPLSTGGTVILVENALRLADRVEAPTLINTVPSAMSELVRLKTLPASARTVCLAGERLAASLADAVHRLLPGVRLLNLYGPTEATTYSTWAAVMPGEESGREPSIGRPIGGTRVLILDRGLRPVPVGAPGELCLAGAGLARGYSRRPDLTAERFVPDGTAGGGAGARLYRTGDRARWRPDGCLELLGRLDQQVKLRGFRIEPGEVEAALAAHPAVREAAVMVRRGDADRRLVAYVAGVPGLDPASLREHLAAHLPAPLVPSVFIVLDRLPLTPNGKVDRRVLAALPLPALAAPAESDDFVPPRDALEEALAAIWSEVLARGRIGAGDDFFALGGHSLLALRVAARVREALGVDLPLRDLFEAPKLAGLAERVRRARRGSAPPLRAGGPGEPAPLSFAQERFWLASLLEPGAPAYHLAGAARLRGALRPAALAGALAEIVARHAVLRTRYVSAGAAEVTAVADPPQPFPVPRVDLSALPEAARETAMEELEPAWARRPFDLARGPVLRAALVQREPAEHDLLLAIHHIAADGAAVDLFFRELAALYGRPGSLPPLPVQYADFARWQRAWLTEAALAPHLVWWQAELAGAPRGLDLAGGTAPGVTSTGGVVRRRLLPPEALAAVRRSCGATPFMMIAAAFLALLGRLTGQGDVLLGTPVSERGRRELEPLLGCLINTLVLRGRMADDPAFEELLRRTRAAALEAWSHQDLPVERLSRRGEALFGALLEVHGERAAEVSLGDLVLTLREIETGTAKFPLSLTVEEAGAELAATLRFRRDLCDGAAAEHLLGALEALMAGAAAEPAARLSALPLLGAAERRQVLAWGDPKAPEADGHETVLSLVQARAVEAPDAPAIVRGGAVLRTRGGLVRGAARLAATLRGLGAGPGTVVGLCLDRTPEMVEAVLAVLAAGAAYLPLDPGYPRAYLAHVLEDSAVSLVLTRGGLRSALPETRGRVVVLPEGADGAFQDALPSLPPGDPEAPAYLLYTSGSTGKPKGVLITQRSLAAYLAWVLDGPLAGIDGLPYVTSLSFDASLKQLFGPLVGGFPVRLVDEETARRPDRLLAELSGPGRVALNCVPSLWQAVLDILDADALPPLARLLLGGERVDRALLDRTFRLFPDLEIWNLYGPTEATANAAAARLAPGEAVTVGRPIRGARLQVVDAGLALLPPGSAGELVLGGTGIAAGYWRQPAATADRFVPDPFSGLAGARLYRTGDRARFRSDGTVELLGRLDSQLKVRGLRVEPEEIEAALLEHPAVAACAAGVRDGLLVAWTVLRSGFPADAAALRRHLEARLPTSFVPAVFIALDALPRTPSGKVDRAALAVPSPAGAPVSPAAEPRTPVAEIVAGLWAEALGAESADRGDDFFAAGGHSLLAARLLSRVRSALGVDLPLRALFAAPTVAGLAAAVEAARRERNAPVEPVTAAAPDERRLLSFAQERLWLLAQWMPDSPAYGIPAAVHLTGALDIPALAAALRAVVRRHEILRTTFSAIAGLPVQVLREIRDIPAALPVIDLAGLDEEARKRAAAALAWRASRQPFDLQRGPLLRTSLLRLGDGEHVLLVSLHHIAADGSSLAVLLGELRALYPTLRALPPLPVQYADFAAWQRRRAEGEALQRDLAWWRDALAGAPAGLDLPADRPRPAWSIHRGGLLPFRLAPEQTAALRALARRGAATLFMALLAGFQALLGRLSGAVDVVVGTAVDQRTPEVEGLIGLFVNLLALRGDLSGDPAFAELLARAQRATLAAYDHRDLPFERLVAALEPARQPGRHPIFQTALSLLSSPLPELALPGLRAEVRELGTGTARFDLTLLAREVDGGVTGSLEYSADLFDAATVQRLLSGLETLLAGAAADPGLPWSRLPLLTAAERRQILEDWGKGAGRQAPEDSVCLPELFLRQAERAPDAVAVRSAREEITYREVARRAASLAHRLRALGVGPDVPVALCLERSPEMLIGLLGIVLAGGAYIPLDLAYPRERLAWMLADSGVRVAVARGPGIAALAGETLRVLDLDRVAEEGQGGGSWALPSVVDPDNLAYILYTSGSTGRPKGVAATHRGVVRLVVEPGYADLGPDETVLQVAPLPFDASTFEIWGALLNGGTLAVLPPGPVALRELGEAVRDLAVTTMLLTTGLFHQMIDEEAASLAGLRQLLTGGDVISMARVRRALAALPGVRLIHAYGPTEATAIATCRTVTAADAARPSLTLGRPLRRTGALLLDRGLEPVPPGVPGQLWLGGDGLARGYWGRPDLTAERFLPHPFPGTPGERLYRTGDLARWLPDGTIDFLGRIDRQVKIRGVRVEPAEVEAALESHPGVSACVVLPRGEAADRRLIAWVMPAAGVAAAADSELAAWCRERLPPFLVPAAFVRVQSMPLDLNGKVDRRALPEPELSRGASAYVAPRTPVEEKVAAVWAEALGLERVGAEDDFFALGGHSLLATQIIARLSRDFGLDLGLRAFFEAPTVSGVAVTITREQIRQGDPERMARLLARVQSLSPEELADFLRENRD
jgi:amino acid adenylation domain-containing protein